MSLEGVMIISRKYNLRRDLDETDKDSILVDSDELKTILDYLETSNWSSILTVLNSLESKKLMLSVMKEALIKHRLLKVIEYGSFISKKNAGRDTRMLEGEIQQLIETTGMRLE